MSVASRNPFDLLGDDGDSSAPAAPKVAPKAAPAPAAAQRVVPGSGNDSKPKQSGRYPNRGGPRNVQRDARPQDDTHATDSDPGFGGERLPPSKGDHRPRNENQIARGGRGGARGGRGRGAAGAGAGAGAAPGSKRQFDRRSGAFPDSEKKVAQGWGAEEGKAELKDEVEGAKDAEADVAAPGTPAEAEPAVEAAAPVAPEEPEEVTKSYDEYLAEKAAQVLGGVLAPRESRKVEGDEAAVFRKDSQDFYSGKEKTSAPKTRAPKKEKVSIEIDGKFATPAGEQRAERSERSDRPPRGDRPVRGGDRPARGGDRPARGAGRGRGAPRGAPRATGAAASGRTNAQRPVDASDEKAFPALGA